MKNGLMVDGVGNKIWYLSGKVHREDGPAVEWTNGDKEWYKNGKLHREDGPAVEGFNGAKCWYINGLLNRETGPAIEFNSGRKPQWFLNGMECSEQEFNLIQLEKKLQAELQDEHQQSKKLKI